jgi:hypothetical protein
VGPGRPKVWTAATGNALQEILPEPTVTDRNQQVSASRSEPFSPSFTFCPRIAVIFDDLYDIFVTVVPAAQARRECT